jgi:hypothetical protein
MPFRLLLPRQSIVFSSLTVLYIGSSKLRTPLPLLDSPGAAAAAAAAAAAVDASPSMLLVLLLLVLLLLLAGVVSSAGR